MARSEESDDNVNLPVNENYGRRPKPTLRRLKAPKPSTDTLIINNLDDWHFCKAVTGPFSPHEGIYRMPFNLFDSDTLRKYCTANGLKLPKTSAEYNAFLSSLKARHAEFAKEAGRRRDRCVHDASGGHTSCDTHIVDGMACVFWTEKNKTPVADVYSYPFPSSANDLQADRSTPYDPRKLHFTNIKLADLHPTLYGRDTMEIPPWVCLLSHDYLHPIYEAIQHAILGRASARGLTVSSMPILKRLDYTYSPSGDYDCAQSNVALEAWAEDLSVKAAQDVCGCTAVETYESEHLWWSSGEKPSSSQTSTGNLLHHSTPRATKYRSHVQSAFLALTNAVHEAEQKRFQVICALDWEVRGNWDGHIPKWEAGSLHLEDVTGNAAKLLGVFDEYKTLSVPPPAHINAFAQKFFQTTAAAAEKGMEDAKRLKAYTSLFNGQ